MLGLSRLRSLKLAASTRRFRVRTLEDLRRFRTFQASEIVTFDIFDTAIRRSVARPDDVFLLAAYRLQQKLHPAIDPAAVAKLRSSAERRARIEARAGEVTLDDIFVHIATELGSPIAEDLKLEELATERDVCFANPEILALYHQLEQLNIPIAFVSDTYLSHDFIAALLERTGYRSAHRLFVSNTFNATKAAGNLFGALRDHLPPGARITHLGDNRISDVLHARRAGWNGFHYSAPLAVSAPPAASVADTLRRSLHIGIRHALPAPAPRTTHAVWHDIGVSVAAPLYLGFAQWLAARLTASPVEKIFFCARDGKIVLEVFEKLRPLYPDLPPASYLLISRRSLVFASIDHLGKDELNFLTSNWAFIPVRDFLTRIGLTPDLCRHAVERHHLTLDTLVNDGNRDLLRAALTDLSEPILALARDEKKLLLQYLREQGCLNHTRIAFSDIGWHGSLQQAFAKVVLPINPACQIDGYYVGTSGGFHERGAAFGSFTGWLLNNSEPVERRAVLSGLPVLELLFTAQHGSVLGYQATANGIEVVLNHASDTAEYAAAAREIQAAALAFTQRYLAAFGSIPPVPFEVEHTFSLFRRLAETPSRAESTAIGDLVHIDGFGSTTAGNPLAKPPSLANILRYPNRLRQEFTHSHWQFGYLGRLAGPFIMSSVLRGWRSLSGRQV